MNFKPVTPFVQKEFSKYESLRSIYMSEGHFLNQFLWENYYHTQYATDDIALYLYVKRDSAQGFFAPLCREEDLTEAFLRMEHYMEDTLHIKPSFYLADTRMVEILTENGQLADYTVEGDRDCYDYVYDADKLRTLSGKIMHKKKNLLNKFMKEYDGRYAYETLGPDNIEEIEQFHEKWLDERKIYDKYHCIDDEEEGIYRLFGNCHSIECQMGGVRIDGELKAYTIGSYDPALKMAMIHIEKADVNYTGLYNYINQQFLLHEYPDAVLVNREDDLGQDNLRQAKLSYKPLRLEEKYTLIKKD